MKNLLKSLVVGFLSLFAVVALAQVQGDVNPNASASSCISITGNMGYRSRDAQTNGDVSALQDLLQSQGYLSSEPTGYFGLLTQAAVQKFQSANGILNSGYVGPLTIAAIKKVSCNGATSVVGTNSNSTPNNNSTPMGCSGGNIFNTQTGQRCGNNQPLPTGCSAGALFNSMTGKPCSENTQPVACTMEAKMCPDGSYVSRSGPRCEFAPCSSTSSQQGIVVSYPKGGENFKEGDPMLIKWTPAQGNFNHYQLVLKNNLTNTLALPIINNSETSNAVTSSKVEVRDSWLQFFINNFSGVSETSLRNNFYIEVTAERTPVIGQTSYVAAGKSNTFSIIKSSVAQPPTQSPIIADLKVNGSDGPITVNAGATISTSWTSNGRSCIRTGKAGGPDPWYNTNVPANGTFSFTFSSATSYSETLQIQCTNAAGQVAYDNVTVNVSANSTQPSILVTYPKGGENMVGGDPMLIKWTPALPVSTIEIVSTDGNYSAGIYGAKYGNTSPITSGVFNYTVANTFPPGTYYVRLTLSTGSTQHVSNIFSINKINQPSITVTRPDSNYYKTWQIGNNMTISWTSNGLDASQPVTIQLERKSPTESQFWNIRTIATNQQGSGSYNWTVPAPTDSSGRIIDNSQYKILVGRNLGSGIGPVGESGAFSITQSGQTQPAVISARLSPNSPAMDGYVTISNSVKTPNVVLGVFSLKSSNASATIKGLNFNLISGDGRQISTILSNVRIVINGNLTFGSNIIGPTTSFTNTNINLPQDQWVDVTLLADANAGQAVASVSAVLVGGNIVGTDSNNNPVNASNASYISSKKTTFQ